MKDIYRGFTVMIVVIMFIFLVSPVSAAPAETEELTPEQYKVLPQVILMLQQLLAQMQKDNPPSAPATDASGRQTVDLRIGVTPDDTISTDSYTGNVHDEYWIGVHPSNGYVKTCTLKSYYSDKTVKTTMSFKTVIDTSNLDHYGRAAIDAVGRHGVLDKVTVSCSTKKGTIRDTVDVSILSQGGGKLAPFKVTLNGDTIERSSSLSEAQAISECKIAYNDYETYNFDRGDVLKCYWDGRLFETVDEWKG